MPICPPAHARTDLVIGRSLLVVGAVVAMCGVSPVASAQTRDGWQLNWVDDFNTLDASRWERLNRRDSFNNERQFYTPDQLSIVNGNLRITATNVPLDGRAYRSGLVRTWAEQTYGRWEVRASLPTGQGMWPAIWLLPRNANWPSGGEIDIMENRGSEPTVVGSAYHFGSSVATHAYVARDFSYAVNGSPVNFHGSMHDYAVEWDAHRIRYFVDGIPHYTLYRNTVPVSSTPMSLILNLAVGGNYGGDPNASTVFPQRFDIDHVRVYSRSADARLQNTSFEETAGEFFAEWSEYSNATNVRIDAVPANARTGTNAVQMFGRFDGAATNNSGLFQEVPAASGQVFQVGAFARNRPGDPLGGANFAQIKIEFLNNNGQVIEVARLRHTDGSDHAFYEEHLLRRTAPSGTAFARAVLEMVQQNGAGGAVNFDDATLRRVLPGASFDLNLDGQTDARDVDALLDSLTADNRAFDFDANAAVNNADVDRYLNVAFGTVRGDIDLGGSVDFDDLLVFAANYRTVDRGQWSLGDFTGEGDIDFADLLILAGNYRSGPASFSGDWALAQSLVPEPALLSVLSLAATALLRPTRSRRRAS